MNIRNFALSVCACLLITGWFVESVSAQSQDTAVTARERATTGSVGTRAPGRMVLEGVARSQSALRSPFATPQISLTSRPISPGASFLVDAIDVIFAELNTTLLYLGDLLARRAGIELPFPADFLSFLGGDVTGNTETDTESTSGGTDTSDDQLGADDIDLDDLDLGDLLGQTSKRISRKSR